MLHLPVQVVINLNENERNDWVIANIKHSGFYRVNYDQENWRLLINQLKQNFSVIDATNRAQLLDDSFNLGRAEVIEQVTFLDIMSYLQDETDSMVFEPAFEGLDYLEDMLSSDYFVLKKFEVRPFPSSRRFQGIETMVCFFDRNSSSKCSLRATTESAGIRLWPILPICKKHLEFNV